jgi:Flp pilus assembly protein TadG
VAPFIIAMMLAMVQVTVIFLAKGYLEAATEAGARLVLTNQVNGMTQVQFHTAICSKITALFTCGNLIVDLNQAPSSVVAMSSAMPQFTSKGTLVNPTNFSIMPSPAKMMLIVMYQWPVFGGPLGLNFANMGNGMLLMVSTQVFQMEPVT